MTRDDKEMPSRPRAGMRRAAFGAGALAALCALAGGIVAGPAGGALGAAAGAALGIVVFGGAAWRGTAPEPATDTGRPALTGAQARLLSGMSLPAVTLDTAGRIVFFNKAARRAIPRLDTGQHFALAFREPDMTAALRKVLSGGGRRRVSFEARGEAQGHYKAHITAMPEAAPDEASVIIILEDRTRARIAERQHIDFVANASHELKTPLASLSALVETLEGPAREDAAARARFLPLMAAQISRMAQLVDDLISLSRIELNEHVAPRGTVDLPSLMGSVEQTLRPIAERAEQAVEIDLRDAPAVVGDRKELERVFVNLLDNALKYGRGPVPVRVHGAPAAAGREGLYGICIADSGPGIARRHWPRLTERFYRADPARSRAAGGTGLGLAIVKHIVARHRGAFDIDSTPGQGSRFTVWLPVVR